MRDLKSGKFIPDKNFRENGSLSSDGYKRVYRGDYYKADKVGRIKEHIYVYEQYYRCCMLRWGIVHHINGVKIDNRIENLEGMTRAKHPSLHKGMKQSEETKKRRSISLKQLYIKRKENS